jgi:hypothetical protein
MQTELCETSLDKRLAEGFRMNYDDVFDFVRQMLLALDVLHRNGLVHLDIKVGCGIDEWVGGWIIMTKLVFPKK